MKVQRGPMSLEEKTQLVMRQKGVGWHEARRILAQRSGAKRKWQAALRRRAQVPAEPIRVYTGSKLILVRAAPAEGSKAALAAEIARTRSPE